MLRPYLGKTKDVNCGKQRRKQNIPHIDPSVPVGKVPKMVVRDNMQGDSTRSHNGMGKKKTIDRNKV
jgi:hypothetical protein